MATYAVSAANDFRATTGLGPKQANPIPVWTEEGMNWATRELGSCRLGSWAMGETRAGVRFVISLFLHFVSKGFARFSSEGFRIYLLGFQNSC